MLLVWCQNGYQDKFVSTRVYSERNTIQHWRLAVSLSVCWQNWAAICVLQGQNTIQVAAKCMATTREPPLASFSFSFFFFRNLCIEHCMPCNAALANLCNAQQVVWFFYGICLCILEMLSVHCCHTSIAGATSFRSFLINTKEPLTKYHKDWMCRQVMQAEMWGNSKRTNWFLQHYNRSCSCLCCQLLLHLSFTTANQLLQLYFC